MSMKIMLGRAGFVPGLLVATAVAAQAPTGGRLCVGSDRLVRYQGAGPCPAGQTEYVPGVPGEKAATGESSQVAELRQKLDFVGKKLADLEQAAAESKEGETFAGKGLKIRAPFEVVDDADKTIFAVRADPRGLILVDGQGRTMVAASALAEGGFVKALAGDGSLQTVMGVNGKVAAFVLRQGGQTRGTLAIAEDGKPVLNMSNDNLVTVVALTQGKSGGGYLSLGTATGASAVEAGTTPQGVGLVRALPVGNPGAGLVGMPGTFIVGRR
jgi:hypothetical protein